MIERQFVGLGMNNTDQAAALLQQGNGLLGAGRAIEALVCYEAALRLWPGYAEALNNCGSALNMLGRHAEALHCFDAVLGPHPGAAEVHANRADTLILLGRCEDGLAGHARALALSPGLQRSHHGLAVALIRLGRPDEALHACDTVLARDPRSLEALCNRAAALNALERHDEALAGARAAAQWHSAHAAVHEQCGIALDALGKHAEAAECFERALPLAPGNPDLVCNLGAALAHMGRHQDAVACFDQVLAQAPEHARAHWNRGQSRLALGEWHGGWDDYEWRWRMPGYARALPVAMTPWLALDAVRDQQLLLVADQGVGEEIMFAGLLHELAPAVREVTVECDPRIAPLLQRSFPRVHFTPRTEPPSLGHIVSGVTAPASRLAGWLRRDARDFAAPRPYLVPDQALAASYRAAMAPWSNGLKVGIVWRGGGSPMAQRQRSIALARWAPLLAREGVHAVSLQHGDVQAEVAQYNAAHRNPLRELEGVQASFDHLAALMAALDLVISVQGTAVHLAGAIGQRCWALIPHAPDWRYGQRGERMPWYESVTLLRQPSSGDWESVFAGAVRRMDGLLQSRR